MRRFTLRLTSPHALPGCVLAWAQGWGSRRGGEGSSAQLRRQMCACPCPLAGGRSDTLPLRAGSAGKPNTSWLLAACRETRLVQHLCENCCCASQRWLFQLKRSLLQETAEICLAVLGETAKAEGLCLYRRKFTSWAPTLCTGAWKKSIANHAHWHRASAGTEVKCCVTHHHVIFYSSSSSRFCLFLLTPTVLRSPATAEVT